MKTKQSYSAIGGVFEYLNSDCDYVEWSQYLIKTLERLGAGREGVDVGCGNGYFTRALYKAGYSVKGMDISPEMLSTAIELARKEGVGSEFLTGDITKLRLCGKVDFITAVNDCINYVPQDKLLSTFKGVCANLKKGGVFIFDISSENKLKNIVGDNLFVKDMDRATLIWFNTFKGDRVEMDLTLFSLNEDGTYSRSDECQTQYIHTEKDVSEALTSAGFFVETEGHLGGSKEERINFICRKL
ncbi:MAG: methyltransferase domain-containing protein [Clostridiales bacterium]|nr:methyltransferase domain-containing protein [Clostridiales bacterium]